MREQLEHDRVIRLLQAKYKRKFDVAINPGNERTAPVGPPAAPWYPDLVLQSGERTKKLVGVVEVETAESLNNLEAMSQWVTFSKLRVPFHLYVPAAGIDSARRLCTDLQIQAAEMWAYHSIGEQIRFTLVSRTGPPERPVRDREPVSAPAKPAAPLQASGCASGRYGATQDRSNVQRSSSRTTRCGDRFEASSRGCEEEDRGSPASHQEAGCTSVLTIQASEAQVKRCAVPARYPR